MNPALLPVVLASKFSPASVPGLALWLDADVGVLNSVAPETGAVSGQTVRCWKDRSASAYLAEQTTGSLQPLFAGNWRGRGAVTFDGVNDYLSIPGNGAAGPVFPVSSGSEFTLVFAAEYLGTSGGVLCQGVNGGADGQARLTTLSMYRNSNVTTAYSGNGPMTADATFGTETGAAVRAVRLGASTLQARRGGVQLSAAVRLTDPVDTLEFRLGQYFLYAAMRVGMVAVWRRALSDAELAKVENFMAKKYAL